MLLAFPALAVVTAFGIAPDTTSEHVTQSLVQHVLPLPDWAPAQEEESHRYIAQERVLRGDTVAALFERLGVRDPQALEFLRNDATGRLLFRQLVPGKVLQAETGDRQELLTLRYFINSASLLEVIRLKDGFSARQAAVNEAPRIVYKSGVVRSSLFAATDAAGIPDAVAVQIARLFATDIDFHSDLRKGDRFSVAYEMIYAAGEFVAAGRIVAAEFVNDGRAYRAVLFRDEDGADAYYSLDGSSRAKAFMRSPLEFSRVSSGFGARFHPIHHQFRAHTGVDFAAAKGTRVLAVADGHVVSAGVRGGYGNAVEIKHGGGVVTLYAHLSAFAGGLRAGSRVRQGEPIGYVGATGWATGPHLHYEFKLSGIHQDPMKVALPKAEPVSPRLVAQFTAIANSAGATMDLIGASSAARFE
ncbi:MAG TPA: M23 family metallopeptidase [Gemmatimonadaceae bacterium]|nr:M23 family metallopeptidase [Gemmatimonadaceae bacterium]